MAKIYIMTTKQVILPTTLNGMAHFWKDLEYWRNTAEAFIFKVKFHLR